MRHVAPLLLLLLLLCAGCPGERPRATEPDVAGLAALDSSLACYAALERQGEEQRLLTWGEDQVFRVSRRLDGWERLDGAAHARVVTSHVDLRSFMVEWLRPAGDRVLCAARLFAAEDGLHRLVPPQPVLVAPLEAGRAWSWSGLADGAPAEADFRITFVGERDGLLPGERVRVVEVEQTTRASGVASRRVQTWVAERGLVDERGTMPTGDAPEGKVHHTKTPRPEEWR